MITRPTTDAATSGIGWSNGMASQVSLPSMLVLRPRRYGYVRAPGLWSRSRRQFLGRDLLEQPGLDVTIGERGHVDALLGEPGVARGIEWLAGRARGVDPAGKLIGRNRAHLEMHVREPVAAVVARE